MRNNTLARRMRRARGFSLIELMVVITIIALLAGAVALNLFGAAADARVTKAKDDIATISTALDLWKLEKGRYPGDLRELTQPTKKHPDGLLKKLPKDPWGNEYVYEKRDRTYVLKSLGADGADGGEGEDADVDPLAEDSE